MSVYRPKYRDPPRSASGRSCSRVSAVSSFSVVLMFRNFDPTAPKEGDLDEIEKWAAKNDREEFKRSVDPAPTSMPKESKRTNSRAAYEAGPLSSHQTSQ